MFVSLILRFHVARFCNRFQRDFIITQLNNVLQSTDDNIPKVVVDFPASFHRHMQKPYVIVPLRPIQKQSPHPRFSHTPDFMLEEHGLFSPQYISQVAEVPSL